MHNYSMNSTIYAPTNITTYAAISSIDAETNTTTTATTSTTFINSTSTNKLIVLPIIILQILSNYI